jgi:hypothetical protein
MAVFPREFAAMLSPKGHRFFNAARREKPRKRERFRIFYELLDPKVCAECVAALDRHMLPFVHTVASPIPPETITRMKENYGELLPKTMRIRTHELNSARSAGFRVAKRLGLIDMLDSESLREFAELTSGLPLESDAGRQVIAYRAGDYSGPHNDHHPENDDADIGYVDLHIMLRTPGVKNQFLVYEEKGHFSNAVDVASEPAIAVYHLPFWHYTTPLMVDPRRPSARRWLILGTFGIDRARLRRAKNAKGR